MIVRMTRSVLLSLIHFSLAVDLHDSFAGSVLHGRDCKNEGERDKRELALFSTWLTIGINGGLWKVISD